MYGSDVSPQTNSSPLYESDLPSNLSVPQTNSSTTCDSVQTNSSPLSPCEDDSYHSSKPQRQLCLTEMKSKIDAILFHASKTSADEILGFYNYRPSDEQELRDYIELKLSFYGSNVYEQGKHNKWTKDVNERKKHNMWKRKDDKKANQTGEEKSITFERPSERIALNKDILSARPSLNKDILSAKPSLDTNQIDEMLAKEMSPNDILASFPENELCVINYLRIKLGIMSKMGILITGDIQKKINEYIEKGWDRNLIWKLLLDHTWFTKTKHDDLCAYLHNRFQEYETEINVATAIAKSLSLDELDKPTLHDFQLIRQKECEKLKQIEIWKQIILDIIKELKLQKVTIITAEEVYNQIGWTKEEQPEYIDELDAFIKKQLQ